MQSNVIFGTIILAFVVYITMRDQLPAYLDLFKKKEKSEGSSPMPNNNKGVGGGSTGSW